MHPPAPTAHEATTTEHLDAVCDLLARTGDVLLGRTPRRRAPSPEATLATGHDALLLSNASVVAAQFAIALGFCVDHAHRGEQAAVISARAATTPSTSGAALGAASALVGSIAAGDDLDALDIVDAALVQLDADELSDALIALSAATIRAIGDLVDLPATVVHAEMTHRFGVEDDRTTTAAPVCPRRIAALRSARVSSI